MAMKQKEAVFAAFNAGTQMGLAVGSEQLFDHVASSVQIGITAGEVEYSKDRNDEPRVKSYSRSLVSNWFKKDERIAGAKYVPQTKRGPQVKDPDLKALNENLKSLKAHSADMTLISRVEEAIATKKAAISAEKGKSKVQSLDDTMASLQALGIDV